jgi:Domain of unknown function (DUF1707)
VPAPGARSRLSDADRDRLAAVLREHYAQGRMSLDELRQRVEVILAAEFADEAASAVDDLPPLGPQSPAKRQRGGRHAQAAAPEPGWLPTSERFRDPSTGTIMRVWVDPSDQGRHYVPESES